MSEGRASKFRSVHVRDVLLPAQEREIQGTDRKASTDMSKRGWKSNGLWKETWDVSFAHCYKNSQPRIK